MERMVYLKTDNKAENFYRVQVAIEENGEVWVGAWKAPIGNGIYSIATEEEFKAYEAAEDAKLRKVEEVMKRFGITDFSRFGQSKQPVEYAAFYKAHPTAESAINAF